jgi:hypothetical protein
VVAEAISSEMGQSLTSGNSAGIELEEMAAIYDRIGDLRKRMPGHDQ